VLPERAGHAVHTVFVDDLDERVASISARGIELVLRETYDNGVRKGTYRDRDGNEIGFGRRPGRVSGAFLGYSSVSMAPQVAHPGGVRRGCC